MDLYRSPDGHVWDIGELGRRRITHPDVVHAYEADGRNVQLITADALATIPRLPDTGLPAWVRSEEYVLMVEEVARTVADELARRMATS